MFHACCSNDHPLADSKLPDLREIVTMCGKLRFRCGPKRTEKDRPAFVYIPHQNKGLCIACDGAWEHLDSGVEIKRCKSCKRFHPWAAFGVKAMACKCAKCADFQIMNRECINSHHK